MIFDQFNDPFVFYRLLLPSPAVDADQDATKIFDMAFPDRFRQGQCGGYRPIAVREFGIRGIVQRPFRGNEFRPRRPGVVKGGRGDEGKGNKRQAAMQN